MMPKKAMSTRFRLSLRAKASVSGAFDTSPSSRNLAKAGLSLSLRRIQTEIASWMTDSRKGMRQPQAAKASSPNALRVATMISKAASRPNDADDWIHPVAAPRLSLSACSAT